jgi:aminoglycoside phosphotransferase (APT) family kinase protein
MPEPAVELVRSNLSEHPASLAWSQLGQGGSGPSEIILLKRRLKSSIYKLAGIGPGASPVIAKYCRRTVAQHERLIYENVLFHLPITAPRFYGSVAGENEFDWLFLEYVQGERYSRRNTQHTILAGRWLGLLHTSGGNIPVATRLPDRGPGHYLEKLRAAYIRLSESLRTLVLSAADKAIFQAVLSQCELLESHWDQIEGWCEQMPRTLVHGDLKPKNVVVRGEGEQASFLPFDWEASGWGVPAEDLAYVNLMAYYTAVKSSMPAFSMDDLHKVAVVGKIFRGISEFHWESLQFDPHWEFCTLKLCIYRDRMNEAVKMTEWGRSKMLQNTDAEQTMTGDASSRPGPSADLTTNLIVETLETAFSRRRGRPVRILRLDREPCEHSTTFHGEHLTAWLAEDEAVKVFFKDFNPAHQIEPARKVRQADLPPSRQELKVYQSILSKLHLGTPDFYAVRWEPEQGLFWLFIEDAGSSRLRDSRNLARWVSAIQWAARFHVTTRNLPEDQLSFLPRFTRDRYVQCAERVRGILPDLASRDREIVEQSLHRFESIIEKLEGLPQSIIHGQYFGRNIMLRHGDPDRLIAVIDWETAAVGPSAYDLVSLTAGKWTDEQRRTLRRAYFEEYQTNLNLALDWESFNASLHDVELYQAMEWLGWWRNRSFSPYFGKWMKELERVMTDFLPVV